MIISPLGPTAIQQAAPTFVLDWGKGLAQSVVGVTRAGVATFVGSNGLIQSASADTQRVDYTNGRAGLLVEEARINLALNSEDFSAASYTAGSAAVSVATDQAEAPDGNTTADKIQDADTTTSAARLIFQAMSATAGTPYTVSLFVKKSDYDWIVLQYQSFGAFSGSRTAYFNISNGTIGIVGGTGTVATIRPYANGWYRISMTATADATSTARARIYMAEGDGDVSYTGVVGNGTFIWGMQFEAGALPSSYIPTTSASVTRNADVATITGADFTNFWRAGKGSALVRVQPQSVTGTRPALQFDDATADNIIALRGNDANPELYIRTGGVDQAQIDAGTIAVNTSYRLAGAWAENSCAASLNSGAPVLDGVATIPTVTQARLGSDGTNYLNGHIEAIEYYGERIPSSALQIVSSASGYQSIIGSVFRGAIIS